MEKQRAAADRLDHARRRSDEMLHGVRILPAPEPIRIGAQADPFRRFVDLHAAAMLKVPLAQDQMAEDVKRQGLPVAVMSHCMALSSAEVQPCTSIVPSSNR